VSTGRNDRDTHDTASNGYEIEINLYTLLCASVERVSVLPQTGLSPAGLAPGGHPGTWTR